MMRWGRMTETELQRQRRGGEWKAFYYVSKSLYPSYCFWRGFETDVDRRKKTECLISYRSRTRDVWIGILPSDYQMYPWSSLYLNDIDSTDGGAPLTFKGFIPFRVYLFIPSLSKEHNKQTGRSGSFWEQHVIDDAAFLVRMVTQKLTSRCAEPSDGATKCPYVKEQGGLSRCSLWASPAPNSCCYTLRCSIEMWAALLIGVY